MDIRQFQHDPATWKILEERARTLAAQDAVEDVTAGEEVLTFRLGESGYSLPVQDIHEVAPLKRHTPLPAAPPYVVGLVNIRGRLLAALDIRPLLDLPAAPARPDSLLLIVAVGGVEFGLLADEVADVRRRDADLAPTLASSAGRGVAWVRGVDRDLNLSIDPATLLTDPRLAAAPDRQ